MKLPAFEYARPRTIAEAVALLSQHNGDAKPLAGGQSLLPVMAFRLASPSVLVDLGELSDLAQIEIGVRGVRLGARVRWRDIEDHASLARAHPLLVAAIDHVAHYQIRNRGTVGGSLAHADPAAELPGIAVTCDGMIHVTGAKALRQIAAADFFLGPLTTALASDELIVALELPPWPMNRCWGFEELARRRGDFALAGVAVYFDRDSSGRACNTHIGVIGAGPHPQRIPAAEAAFNGHRVDEQAIVRAAQAAAAGVEPFDDIHASAQYRRALVQALTERALTTAQAR